MLGIPATPERDQKLIQGNDRQTARSCAARSRHCKPRSMRSCDDDDEKPGNKGRVSNDGREQGLSRSMTCFASYPLAHATKVGILAGWGRYPVVIAEALRAPRLRSLLPGR